MKISLIKLFTELADIDKNGCSRLVSTNEFKDKYAKLVLGNGGSWCRFDSTFGKKYKVITIKKNGKINYSWDCDDIEKTTIKQEIDDLIEKNSIILEKGASIKYIKLYGFQENSEYLRPISKRVRDYFTGKSCVVCGSNHNTVIDHKNGLYNDERVLHIDTQKIDDFQVLCNHCNLQKRQTIKNMKKSGKRYSALNIESISIFNMSFTQGDENYDINDPNWGLGTYWDDPCDFVKKCINLQKNIE
jgi:5-methylcytosine-specific restriction endonuclease McrA